MLFFPHFIIIAVTHKQRQAAATSQSFLIAVPALGWLGGGVPVLHVAAIVCPSPTDFSEL